MNAYVIAAAVALGAGSVGSIAWLWNDRADLKRDLAAAELAVTRAKSQVTAAKASAAVLRAHNDRLSEVEQERDALVEALLKREDFNEGDVPVIVRDLVDRLFPGNGGSADADQGPPVPH